ncbi:MAG: D-cysteine desulfhydrase family protein [bacterium]|jgi:1-aminocyclopropane-1-carboxylate deaminase|nr:D-cysteine desulfhydrase family protein [Bacillota bacterium]HHW55472.1 D-cysteine desulfhydrase family protein [Bacillota bacterium]
MDINKLKGRLAEYPQVELMWGRTPIVHAANISRELGIDLFIKRDDLTGLALGGNKTRKLEFLLGEARSKNCDTVITAGAVHSNHALQTAAAAQKLGMKPVLVLRGVAENKGNYFLDRLLGADIRVFDVEAGGELKNYMEEIQGEYIAGGKRPYLIPVGGSSPTGVLGYIKAVIEIMEQCKEMNLAFDYLVSATSSGGTQAGILLGCKAIAPGAKPLCIGVGDPREELLADVRLLVEETSSRLGLEGGVPTGGEIEEATIGGYGFGGYGTIVKEVVDLIRSVARKEGLYLDPVYTGKAFLGLMDLAKREIIPPGSRVLFLHTGGLGGLFQYEDMIGEMLP